jgi:hypothetical protein
MGDTVHMKSTGLQEIFTEISILFADVAGGRVLMKPRARLIYLQQSNELL